MFGVPDAVATHHQDTEAALYVQQSRNWKLEEANTLHRQLMSNSLAAIQAMHELYRNERYS